MDSFKQFISESNLSKSELQKVAGRGPNSGILRIEIFANKIKKSEEHITVDGETVVIKQITMDGKVYNVNDMNSFVTDFENVNKIAITNPNISLSKLAKTPEYGGEGGGEKISTSTQELMTAALVIMNKKYNADKITVEDASKIIEESKKQWGKIVGAKGKETLLNQFSNNWYDLATSISSANAILKIVSNPDKVFWTGQAWDKEIQGFNPPVGNIKDYNSSDIVVRGGGKYYGFSLKKKKSSKDADPTLINKPITGKKSLLKDFVGESDYNRIEKAKTLFFIRMLAAYPPFIKKYGKNAYSFIRKMDDKQFKKEIQKIPNDCANDMLAGRGIGGRQNIFWQVVNNVLTNDTSTLMKSFLKLIFKVDLQPILDQTKQFEFYLLTGIGQRKGDSIGVEPAEVKDLPSTIEALTKIFKDDKIKLGKTLDKNGKQKKLPWEYGGDERAPEPRGDIRHESVAV